MTVQFGQFGFQASLYDDQASLRILQDGSRLIIEETSAPPRFATKFAGTVFGMMFLGFGLFIAFASMTAASEVLRVPAAALFALIGLGIIGLVLRQKKSIRRLVADNSANSIAYGNIRTDVPEHTDFQPKGTLDFQTITRFDTGSVDHSAPGAERAFTGLYVQAPDGPRGGLLVMGALYEIEIAIDYLYRHMNDGPAGVSNFADQETRLPRSFVPQNRDHADQ